MKEQHMYIVKDNTHFGISPQKSNAVAEIKPPIYIENGEEKSLTFSKAENTVYIYADDTNEVRITVEARDKSLFFIKRKWTNTSPKERDIQTCFRIAACFEPKKYLIPCVTFNGNEFGNGNEPKGLTKDGQKWIYAYDRSSIPSCTVTENADIACALFASGEDAVSLQSSCSIFMDQNGVFYQEILHPVIEAPVTYSARDAYSPAYETFIHLKSGESFECGMFLFVGKPRWENFGICDTLDHALSLFPDKPQTASLKDADVWNRSITFAKSLISDYKGKKGFIIGFVPDGKGGFVYRDNICFQLAWCGQNILLSRMLIEDYVINNDQSSLDQALEILDTWVKNCVHESGLIATQLRHFEDLDTQNADTCNLGYGAYEFLRCYERLKALGIEKDAYFKAAKGICDFFCENFSENYGFGKDWSLRGDCRDTGGSIGAFIICALAKIHSITKQNKYLDTAEKALMFYVHRDLDHFCCTAGALDTCCVDKETSAPFIISAILLFEITQKTIYIEIAEKAAYYFTSWMYHYEPLYDQQCEIAHYGICIKGLTAVSTQHHHLDMYAGIVVPYLRRLASYTGNERWNIRAELMWRAVLQYIGDGNLKIHDAIRPIGSQNEALFHCSWGFGFGNAAKGYAARGRLNDWLVAWPCAFRLSVLAEKLDAAAN